MTKEVKSITIVFENCEYVTIPKNRIGKFLIDGLEKCIYRFACNSIQESDTANSVIFYIYNRSRDEALKRISQYKDITSIYVLYENGVEEHYYVDYDEEDDAWDSENANENVEELDNGDIILIIDKQYARLHDKLLEDVNNTLNSQTNKYMPIAIKYSELIDDLKSEFNNDVTYNLLGIEEKPIVNNLFKLNNEKDSITIVNKKGHKKEVSSKLDDLSKEDLDDLSKYMKEYMLEFELTPKQKVIKQLEKFWGDLDYQITESQGCMDVDSAIKQCNIYLKLIKHLDKNYVVNIEKLQQEAIDRIYKKK